MPKTICALCGRGKQEGRRWSEARCVCCDVHQGRCRHRRVAVAAEWSGPLVDLMTGEVKRMTVKEQAATRA